jgi:tripartite-type tricarboxylate transporter receptor subunit TctC
MNFLVAKQLFQGLTTLFMLACSLTCSAQSWPTKPIHLIVPFNAGGTIDTVARSLGQRITETLKQPVIVENKPGGGALIGANAVAKAPPDGHTLLITTNGLAIASGLYKKVPFDPKRDLIAVSELMSTFMTVAVGPKVQVNQFKDFLALARSKPGELNYGSTGIGSAPHLVMELLKINAKVNLSHIPYSGDAPMNQALIAGDIDAVITPLSGAYESMKAGNLKILAITDTKRSDRLPNVPTVSESGLPGFEYLGWVGIFVPGGTPIDVVKKIQIEFSKTLNSSEFKEKMNTWGYEGVGSTTETFTQKFQGDLINYAKVIKDAKIDLE